MAVKKIFWEDPYLTELGTIVTSVEENTVTLKETIVYAFSGGQQSDDGTINHFRIHNALKKGKEIYYTIDKDHHLKVGDKVWVEIDWAKRYRIMKLHFAAEIILELVNQHFGNPAKIGANITSEKARIDFLWEGNISEIFPLLAERSGKLIGANKPVISDFSNEEVEIRFWKIEGFGQVACGGTHIRSTGEIGPLRLKRDRQGKGKERIEIYLVD
ncbi:MAG: alanyl-tRNA editing protein [Chitinophagales bacterium]|nr:alanyl-tRNA editing protein [Chitinophagales bacterium]